MVTHNALNVMSVVRFHHGLLDTEGFADTKDMNPQLTFSFSEIESILRQTAKNHYLCDVPLPYTSPHGSYKATPVPEILHFVWIGSTVPQKYVENVSRFRDHNPTYRIILWVDRENEPIPGVEMMLVDSSAFVAAETYDRAKGIKHDILRLEVIYKYGGIYSDIDAISLRALDDNFKKPFLSYEPEYWKDIAGGFIGCAAGDQFVGFCLHNMKAHFEWAGSMGFFEPSVPNVMRLASGVYILACLFCFDDLSEMQFINQYYTIIPNTIGYSYQTNDGCWMGKLPSLQALYVAP